MRVMRLDRLEHISSTTYLLVESLLRQRLGHSPGFSEWVGRVNVMELFDKTWVVLYDNKPILHLYFTDDGEANWELVPEPSHAN